MFSKVLIANRGEIACRIIRACQQLGAKTVAIYSEPDRDSLHVKLADEAVCVGPAASSASYLSMSNVLMAAIVTGAEAVHPGYGFFSERVQFADALQAIGIKFVGPSVEAIARMGDKAAAISAARAADCPVVPGSGAILETLDDAILAAEEIGFPLLVKATAGGGGKGIRRAESAEDLARMMPLAQQEAEASFGSGDVYLEKLISNPRHVEVQVLADTFQNCVYLGERECSVQTPRHQKIIEEAPFALLCEKTRRDMGEASVRLARSVGYVNAGTVEFLMDAEGDYYFIEMNTRLQVEHPVTEQVTGIDIVEAQLRVAAGEELPFAQEDIHWTGHSIEARITAEDPSSGFAPSCGRITAWSPPKGDGIRVETHIVTGAEITPYYDSLLAKVIVTDSDRPSAATRLEEALAAFKVRGVRTNIPFLIRIVREPRFRAGAVDTGLVASLLESETTGPGDAS